MRVILYVCHDLDVSPIRRCLQSHEGHHTHSAHMRHKENGIASANFVKSSQTSYRKVECAQLERPYHDPVSKFIAMCYPCSVLIMLHFPKFKQTHRKVQIKSLLKIIKCQLKKMSIKYVVCEQ